MSADMKQKKKAEPFVWQYPVVMRRGPGFWQNEWEAVEPAIWFDGSPPRYVSPLKFTTQCAAETHASDYLANLSPVARHFVLWHGAKFYPVGDA